MAKVEGSGAVSNGRWNEKLYNSRSDGKVCKVKRFRANNIPVWQPALSKYVLKVKSESGIVGSHEQARNPPEHVDASIS